MPSKLTYTFVKQYFKEQKCELLETEYINANTKMKYVCVCKNESYIRFSKFQNGQRCIKCGGKEKLTFSFVKKYFKEQNCELISKEYINAHQLLKYICVCQNTSDIKFYHFYQGHRCTNCRSLLNSENKKFTYEYVYNYFKERNCELLSNKYIGIEYKLKYLCECKDVNEITFNNFKNHNQTCKNCGIKKNQKLQTYTYDYVYNYFKEQNCELLSKEYINAQTQMSYVCSCKNISNITFNSFQQGSRCMKCAGNEKYTYEHVKTTFEKEKCILLSKEYIGTNNKLEYICSCNSYSFITFSKFLQGQRCNNCKNKTELKIMNFLKENYELKQQVKFEWCKNKTYLPFDFVIEQYKLIIELDGPQHFKQISNWKLPELTQKSDIFKMKSALKNNYRIIRISQEDVYSDNIDWKLLLENAINNNLKVQYISNNINLYDNHKELFKTQTS